MRFFSLRALFLLGFIVAMPVLALPSVARRVDNLLYGPPPADFGRAPAPPTLMEESLAATSVAPVSAATSGSPVSNGNGVSPGSARPIPSATASPARSAIAPARFDEPSPAPQNLVQPAQAAPASTTAATRYEPTTPPPLPASPPFATAETAPSSEPKIDEQTMARLQQIRQRLEQLGAEYVLVDMQDSGRFRFHCRVLVDPQTRYMRPFDATSFDPVAAGQHVLRDVEKWRQAAASSPAALTP